MAENTSDDVLSPSQVVEFKDDAEQIMERLMGNKKQLDVISIVGMAGLGKTTLALKVYNNESIAYHFYVRAWVTVSQNYDKRNLLVGILSSLNIHPNGEIHEMSDEKLSEKLYKRLKRNRYLIVLDDIWNTRAWDDLKRSFPNDKVGSRIILTSRIKDVCLYAKPDSIPYELRFLSEEESWDLLREKIFHGEICPPELMEIGKEIAKKCQGLPLAIVVIGGLLAKTEKNIYRWKEVGGNIGSSIASDPKQCMETLELSFNHLPNHLKPLFLYLGIFPEDYEIPVFKLVWLWIAEGFVKKNIGDETLEDTAVDYLIDLIGRSLILISKKTSNGKVKSCRIHDLLRDLCWRKAEEENFMHEIDPRLHIPSSCRSYSSSSKAVANKVSRLSINSHIYYYIHFKYYPNTSSIVIHGTYKTNWFNSPTSFSLQPFRLLKVLDLKDARNCQIIPSGIEHVVHLRYLAIKHLSNQLAQSISNLRNLETLIFIDYEIVSFVKVDISNMTKLRHLKIINRRGNGYVALDGSSLLVHLQTMCSLWINSENYCDSLKSTPNLRRLKCIFSKSSILSSSRGLEFLVKLESLTMGCKGLASMNRCCDLPASLKKITLSNFCFDRRYFSKLANLPKLEVLKLISISFNGRRWDTSSEESGLQFPKLKFLKIKVLNFVEWNASKDHSPSLQRLVLESCQLLKAIPSDIGDTPTLEMIELKKCSRSAEKSAWQILEEQRGVGNKHLKIFIHPITSISRS